MQRPQYLNWAVLPTLAVLAMSFSGPLRAQDPVRPTFSSSVTLVPITALVRDSRLRLVRDLPQREFEVFERGQPRRIVEFKATEDAPISVAFLFDTSGSMGLATNLQKGRRFVQHFLSRTNPAADEAALFTFHKSLRQEVAFTNARARIDVALDRLMPWGLTSMYDAVADTARQLADRPSPRKAVVLISDGLDTSSALTAQQVARLASAIDVPVFVVAVISSLDDQEHAPAPVNDPKGGLADLAHWTGGDLVYVTSTDQIAATAGELLSTLRHQYSLAIESASRPGWYSLEVRTKRQGLTVRSRRGYFSDADSANRLERQQ